ncbi:glycosyltransferase family 39 protein, partial [Patescibacteria group bacterium]|nr:glycosyltransferase family 39 protein [Patescibacteria group bacterium]
NIKKFFTTQALPLSVAIFTFLISAIFSRIGVDPHHDGIVFKPAIDLLEGKILFKNSYTQYGALLTILQSLSLLIFGKYLIVIKLQTSFFYALTSFFLFKIWTIYEKKWLSLLSCLIWLAMAPFYIYLFLPWSSVYSLFFLVLTLYFLILSLQKHRHKYLFFSGITIGATFWTRQPVGIFLLIFSYLSFLLTLPKNKTKLHTVFRETIFIILGLLTISIPILSWITINGAFHDWWLQSIVSAVVFGRTVGQNFQIKVIFQNLFTNSVGILSLWKLLPIFSVLYLLRSIIKKIRHQSNNSDNVQIILSLVSISSWMQYYPVPCFRHLFWAATPMMGLLPKFVHDFQHMFIFNKTKPNKIISAITLIILLLPIIYLEISIRMSNAVTKLQTVYYTTQLPTLKHMKMSMDEVLFYNNAFDIINTYPEKNIITNGPDAIYGTLKPNTINFHPMYVNWLGINKSVYPNYTEKLSDYVIKNKPIIFSPVTDLMPDYCPIGKPNWNQQILTIPCELQNQ